MSVRIGQVLPLLIEPPGCMNSALPGMAQPVISEALRSRSSGVLPIASINVAQLSIVAAFYTAGVRRCSPAAHIAL